MRSFIDVDTLSGHARSPTPANGLGGLVVPAVFAGLPVDVDLLFGELDGTFPNHPADPIQPENLRDLQRRVVERRADVGLAFDGDADRVFLVDDQAQPLSGSLTTTIVAASILTRLPAGVPDADRTVVHTATLRRYVPVGTRTRRYRTDSNGLRCDLHRDMTEALTFAATMPGYYSERTESALRPDSAPHSPTRSTFRATGSAAHSPPRSTA